VDAVKLTGSVPIVPIPFDANEDIDEEALRRLVQFCVDKRFSAICLPAYGSEFYKLSESDRVRVVKIAVQQAAGRVPVIAQSNHGSSRVALELARTHVENGADMISVALPRQFALSEDDLLRYLQPVLNGVSVPSLVQDFSPAGGTIGADFAARLLDQCFRFSYLKMEEPMLAPKLVAILERTGGKVGVLEGTGGLYLLELVPYGLCGIMPGLAVADALDVVFKLRAANRNDEAFELYEKILPRVLFSFQSFQHFEVYMYCEKRLLQARGLLHSANCRNASFTPDPYTVRYVDELNERLLPLLRDLGNT
jgi:4-hydroxy-tetrahydrodipicolinate synthase